jgi:hypothetical protein
MLVNDIAITSLETITGFDIITGDLLFVLDELTDATISNTEDKQEVTGRHGHKITNLKRNKGVTINGTNGIVSGGLIATQTGGVFQNTTTQIMWADYLTVNGYHTATTNFIAVGTSGAEIEELYIRNADGTLGTKFTQGSSVGSRVFTYDTSTKVITFNSAITEGTEIVAYYKRNITANTIDNNVDSYSKKCVIYVDALGEDKCSNVFRIQFYIPKADFTGQFDFEMGDNQTAHDFEAESLTGACVAGRRDILWTYTIFGAKNNVDTLVQDTDPALAWDEESYPEYEGDLWLYTGVIDLVINGITIHPNETYKFVYNDDKFVLEEVGSNLTDESSNDINMDIMYTWIPEVK